jgi:hypothetical protein
MRGAEAIPPLLSFYCRRSELERADELIAKLKPPRLRDARFTPVEDLGHIIDARRQICSFGEKDGPGHLLAQALLHGHRRQEGNCLAAKNLKHALEVDLGCFEKLRF